MIGGKIVHNMAVAKLSPKRNNIEWLVVHIFLLKYDMQWHLSI
jgi:hypothetical protein